MSKNLTDAAVQEFDSEVKQEYQGRATLRSSVSIRTNVTGDAYKFAGQGKGIANQKATQADVTPMDITYTRPTANLENWNAPEYTDIFDQAEVNFDEKAELAQTIAKAIGRREDQLILDSMLSGTITYATTEDGLATTGFSATVATNFTVAELRTASKHFNTIEAPTEERHIALQANALESLLGTTQVTSADFNSVRALVQGEVDTFMGFKFHVIGDRAEGGIAGVTTAEHAYLWHKAAIGLAVGLEMKTTIDWVAQKTSWLANGIYKAGAVVREAQGIVRIIYDETAS